MIHLAKHIELLLLDNDCVIIPRLGGFVAHYTSASIEDKEHVVIPPYRTLGFNPQLKINDGVLAESYMNLYGINFYEANKRMNSEIDELLSIIHEEGKYKFVNIGELHFNIYGIYEFKPYDNKLTSPELYGLDILSIKELSGQVSESATPVVQPILLSIDKNEQEEDRDAYIIRLNRTFVRSAIAVAAMILLLFTFSTPIKNNNILSDNQAKIVPDEILNQLKSKSILTRLVSDETKPSAPLKTASLTKPRLKSENHIKEQKTEERQIQEKDLYQLIIASSISKKQARLLAKGLKEKGYDDAQVLTSGKMVRVSIAQCSDEHKAQNMLNKLSKKTEYKNMWVMKEKSSPSTDDHHEQ